MIVFRLLFIALFIPPAASAHSPFQRKTSKTIIFFFRHVARCRRTESHTSNTVWKPLEFLFVNRHRHRHYCARGPSGCCSRLRVCHVSCKGDTRRRRGKKTVSMEPLRRAGVSSQWNSSADMSVHVYFIILFSGLHCLVCVHGIGFSTRRKTFFVPIVYLYRRFWGIQSCVAVMYISKRLICLRKYFESKRRRQCRRKCIIYIYIYTTCCVYVSV